MEWNWSDTFKTAIIGALGYIGQYVVKRLKPTWKLIKRFIALAETTESISSTLIILRNRQLAAFNIDRDPIFIFNLKGEYIYVNPAWLEMVGMDNEEQAYGYGYVEAIHPEDRVEQGRIMDNAVKHPSAYHGQLRFKNRRSGNIILAICRTELIYNEKKQLEETIGRLYIISE